MFCFWTGGCHGKPLNPLLVREEYHLLLLSGLLQLKTVLPIPDTNVAEVILTRVAREPVPPI